MASGKCMIPNCLRPASNNRGLCLVCYSRAKKMVEEKKYTWDQLVKLGVAGPDNSGDPFTEALNKAENK